MLKGLELKRDIESSLLASTTPKNFADAILL